MKADLHIHTTASDGRLAPREAVAWAKACGMDALAITDHDSVAGLAEAEEAAREMGVGFVRGIELSCYSVCEIHILGYGFEPNAAFLEELDEAKALRRARNEAIGRKLTALGIDLGIDYLADGVGRMNIARKMVELGVARDVSDAFDRFLGAGGAAYVESKRLTPIGAVRMLKNHGAFVSVAHPKKFLQDGRLDMLLQGLKRGGLDGLEVNYPGHSDLDRAALLKMCDKHRLLPTGGSDYHGEDERAFESTLDPRTARRLGLR